MTQDQLWESIEIGGYVKIDTGASVKDPMMVYRVRGKIERESRYVECLTFMKRIESGFEESYIEYPLYKVVEVVEITHKQLEVK